MGRFEDNTLSDGAFINNASEGSQNQLKEIEAQIHELESSALITEAHGDLGTVIYRNWQPWGDQMGGELVVMLHGGSGSWSHWIRNIPRLSDYYELLVPDLPSLGDSSLLPKGTTPQGVAGLVSQTLRQMVGPRRFHLVAFSWGCVIAALAAPDLAAQVKSILLVGPASTGRAPEKSVMKPLVARNDQMSEADISAANRENLGRLMIYSPQKIDELAVVLQNRNTAKARYNSPKYAMTELLLDGLSQTTANLLVVYGAQDAVSVPNLKWRESQILGARPDAEFETVSGVGHWLQYESAEWFNQRAVAWIDQNIFA